MSVTIAVPISDDLAERLEKKARTAGVDREEYVRALVARDLEEPRRFDEILHDFRAEGRASGMADAELEELFDEARRQS